MPSQFFKTGVIQYRPLTAAILVVLSSGALLTACGGGSSATDRTPNNSSSTTTAEKTFVLTIHSQVAVQNAKVTLTDAATGQQIDQQTISNGSTATFNVTQANASNKLIIATLSAVDANSTYYDPTLNKAAPLNSALHVALVMPNAAYNTNISPFTEIAYQRALVRAGSMDVNNPNLNLLAQNVAARQMSNANIGANGETRLTFIVSPILISPDIGSKADLDKLVYNQTSVTSNSQDQYIETFLSMGHYMLQHTENPTDPTPYLTFAKRAAEDMRDGSLDGLTVMGAGNNAGIRLSNTIVSNMRADGSLNINNSPANNTAFNTANYQLQFKQNYGNRLKNNVLAFLNTLDTIDANGLNYFQQFDYIQDPNSQANNIGNSKLLHTQGAGNYKRAFGIDPIQLSATNATSIYNASCQPVSQKATSSTTTQYATPDCQKGLDADGSLDGVNAIEPLVGNYTSSEGCKLAVQYNGDISLSYNGQTFASSINRDETDALIRVTPGKEDYVMNVASPQFNPPQFLQFRISNQVIQTVTAGTSTEMFPTSLSNPQLVCHFSYNL